MASDPLSKLHSAVAVAVAGVGGAHSQKPTIERPKNAEQGDYSTNAAMLLAPILGEPPRKVAERITPELEKALGADANRVEVAGPGFLNLFLSDAWYRAGVRAIVGTEQFGAGPRVSPAVLLEFVSANPTGPLTVAGARGAAYGDSLARLLEAAGQPTTREYYVNDAGTQIEHFAASIAAQMRGDDPPENGYAGAYIEHLAQEMSADGTGPDDLEVIAKQGVEAMRSRIEQTLDRFGVRFDTWSSEVALRERGALNDTLDLLAEAGETYEADSALWLRTTRYGDDKDRVLVRSDGQPTYFAVDIAYHRDKLSRGAELMIVPLGADHHGYVPRMKAAVGILSGDPERYEAPIMQLVNVVEHGERTRMSKRRGEFVALDDLISDIGADAARFFLLQRSHDTVIDLDLELARSSSQENPVYYVQYAHARIASILRRAGESASFSPRDHESSAAASAQVPCEPAERVLIRRLLEFPGEVLEAADRRAPHRICAYSMAVAADFHVFYRDCRVIGADAETGIEGVESARLAVCLAAKQVIADSLDLLGTSGPEEM